MQVKLSHLLKFVVAPTFYFKLVGLAPPNLRRSPNFIAYGIYYDHAKYNAEGIFFFFFFFKWIATFPYRSWCIY